jgi:hypothetical protein
MTDNALPVPDLPVIQAVWSLPFPLLVLDDAMQVLYHNEAAGQLLEGPVRLQVTRHCGEVLQCLHALQAEACCGQTTHCPDCSIRGAALEVIGGQPVARARAFIQRHSDGPERFTHNLITAIGFTHDGRSLALVMLQDIPELVATAGIIPMCAWCHRVRTDAGEWQELYDYIERRFDVAVTHSICPHCGPAVRNKRS